MANQFIPTTPATKKRIVDRPIRIESTESVSDWATRMGAIGFLPILNTEALENIDLTILSDYTTYE